MPELKWELPPDISNSTMRRVQRALDRDFRVAIDNNRADRQAGRGLAGGLKAPNTRGTTRQLRADTASLVNDRLRQSWPGSARVAFNWLLRQFRRRQGQGTASAPEGRGDYAAGEPVQPSMSTPYGRGDYRAAGEHQGPALSAPYGRGDHPTAAERQRPPLTQEQVDRWTRVLRTRQLDEPEQRSLRSAIVAAYFVDHNPDLHQLYRKDPREMQNLAAIIAAADRIADRYEPQAASRYEPQPAERYQPHAAERYEQHAAEQYEPHAAERYEPYPADQRVLPPPQQTFDFGFEQPVPSAPPTPIGERSGAQFSHGSDFQAEPARYPPPPSSPAMTQVSTETSQTPQPSASHYTEAELNAMLPRQRDELAGHDPATDRAYYARLRTLSSISRQSPSSLGQHQHPQQLSPGLSGQSRSQRANRGRK
ncbi:hypothetical protein QQG74_01185 [Micromonospora sp. FIMYZ51]|uniref:hypothetical protein n=1 Tax=Micromonospora sp. FIMYZ51 TaxID=3051832 RepID=UPI00311DCCB0